MGQQQVSALDNHDRSFGLSATKCSPQLRDLGPKSDELAAAALRKLDDLRQVKVRPDDRAE
jgi:hypothetical protein